MWFMLTRIVSMFAIGFCFVDDFFEQTTARNYHRNIGIPRAALLKAAEDVFFKKFHITSTIAGGEAAHIKEVPYQAGLIINLNASISSVCGGSLISNSRVLTAAHCYSDGEFEAKSFIVVLGSNMLYEGGKRITTSDISVHPKWYATTPENDLAILRFPPIQFTENIQPVALPGGLLLLHKFVGWTALASGFGITGDDVPITITQHLSSVSLTIISNVECAAIYGDLIQDSNICTIGNNNQSTCSGDSGGPLVITIFGKRVLVGATSFGSIHGCQKGYPVAYTRITSFVEWVTNE